MIDLYDKVQAKTDQLDDLIEVKFKCPYCKTEVYNLIQEETDDLICEKCNCYFNLTTKK